MKREQHKSRLLEAVHETAQDLHKLGFIDKRTMREYDVLCVNPISAYSAEQIRSLRERYRLSQAVMASGSIPASLPFRSGKSEISIRADLLSNS